MESRRLGGLTLVSVTTDGCPVEVPRCSSSVTQNGCSSSFGTFSKFKLKSIVRGPMGLINLRFHGKVLRVKDTTIIVNLMEERRQKISWSHLLTYDTLSVFITRLRGVTTTSTSLRKGVVPLVDRGSSVLWSRPKEISSLTPVRVTLCGH